MTLPATAFDYSELDVHIVELAKQTAEKLRSHQQRMVRDIIEIGTDLIRVKDGVGHGCFGAWLKAEFGQTYRTAHNYILAAERFGTKSETVSHLPQRTVYLLAAKSTPAAIAENVVSKIEAGEAVDPETIRLEVEAARSEAKLQRREEQQRQRRKNSKARRDRAERERVEREAEEQRRLEAARTVAADLIREFGADTVRRIALALDDWDVRTAVAEAVRETTQ